MNTERFDFAIIGSGFGGNLLGLILQRLGYRVAVIDRGKHPRFAIGESSTPLADSILKRLCQKFDLPKIGHLASYGSARACLPDVTVGLKRGFSYFRHERGKVFNASTRDCEQLVVAASSSDEASDTHWLRSDVDAFIASQLGEHNVQFSDQSEIELIEKSQRWRISFRRKSEPHRIEAGFVIDASGRAGVLLKFLGIRKSSALFQSHTRALYAHFAGVKPWHDLFRAASGDVSRHPFRCDHAAVHHLIEDGWMWQLGFDNGVMSAGFSLNWKTYDHHETFSPDQQWKMIIDQYPTLTEQFASSKPVAPESGICATGRLQFLADKLCGEDWLLLPGTAGFVDPLHSTGIAHTLSAIERLADIFDDRQARTQELSSQIERYAFKLRQEILAIDDLVSVCLKSLDNFDAFVAATMLYFAAATYSEHLRCNPPSAISNSFLLADDRKFQEIVCKSKEVIIRDRKCGGSTLSDRVGDLIAPYNLAGLCDQSVQNMYRYTASPEKT